MSESKLLTTTPLDEEKEYSTLAESFFSGAEGLKMSRATIELSENRTDVRPNESGTDEQTSQTDAPSQKGTYLAKQKWEGHVLEVKKETFRAWLTPLVGEPGEHIAEIYLDEVDETERDHVQKGSVFYWNIGYRDTSSGRRRESMIRFRLLPDRTDQELEAAVAEGQRLLDLLNGK